MDYIASVWATYCFSPQSVLDLACGTGSASLILAREGRQVTGVDVSPTMLEVARRKLQAAGLYAEFVVADMRRFALREPVDAAICLFDSLNYLLTPESVRAALRAVARALKPGGLFVFDMNTPERLAAIKKEVHLFEGEDHFLIWSDFYDPDKKWWRVKLTGFLKSRGRGERATDASSGAWVRFDELHRERAFPIEDTAAWLKGTGFEVLAVYDSFTFKTASKSTSRAYFVARKMGR
jgi:SAM-dependent methyltransferase